jgi:mannose-6-phosphate isomerase-like protein (cupin superfamily)
MSVVIEEVEVRADGRGFVFEAGVHGDLAFAGNLHVVVNESGAVRGDHFHRHTEEVLIVAGPSFVRLREEGAVRDVQVPEGRILRFRIPAGVSHAVRNTGSRRAVLLVFQMGSRGAGGLDGLPDLLLGPVASPTEPISP